MQNAPVIGMALFEDATQLDFTAPYEVFARLPGASVHVLAATPAPVRTDRGLMILPTMTYADCPKLDVLFIPGGPGQIAAEHDAQLMRLIRRQAEMDGAILASVCTGALLLGAAGLLRGRRATTHWMCLDILAVMGAQPINQPVVEDGNIITSAGVINGLDLALYLAKKIAGESVAARLARGIEYPHASNHTEKVALEKLSAELLAQNPYHALRMEAARKSTAAGFV